MVDQCNPPCPPHLCEQWSHQGMCALEKFAKCSRCGKDGARRGFARTCCVSGAQIDAELGLPALGERDE